MSRKRTPETLWQKPAWQTEAASVPSDWRLVPVEPTREMIEAFKDKYREFWPGSWPDTETSRELVQAALRAAPSPEKG